MGGYLCLANQIISTPPPPFMKLNHRLAGIYQSDHIKQNACCFVGSKLQISISIWCSCHHQHSS